MFSINTIRPDLLRAPRLVQCVSCFEEKPDWLFTHLNWRCRDRHTASTCISCVKTWVRRSLEEHGTRVTCPQCPAEIGYFAIRAATDRAAFERYEMRLLMRLLDTETSFVWCSHGCGSGQWHPAGAAEPIFTCHHCRRRTCVVHGLPWHPDLTCGQFDAAVRAEEESRHRVQEQLLAEQRTRALLFQRAREDEASRELVRSSSKPCPNCYFDIAKISGCDHMHCRVCDHHFCWVCLAPYGAILRDGNAAHGRDCSYYRP